MHNFQDNICKICGDVATNERACTHAEYNELCAICHDIEDQAGYAFKEGLLDNADDWSEKVEYYNRPEPMEDEPSEDDIADRITDNAIQDNLEGN